MGELSKFPWEGNVEGFSNLTSPAALAVSAELVSFAQPTSRPAEVDLQKDMTCRFAMHKGGQLTILLMFTDLPLGFYHLL